MKYFILYKNNYKTICIYMHSYNRKKLIFKLNSNIKSQSYLSLIEVLKKAGII